MNFKAKKLKISNLLVFVDNMQSQVNKHNILDSQASLPSKPDNSNTGRSIDVDYGENAMDCVYTSSSSSSPLNQSHTESPASIELGYKAFLFLPVAKKNHSWHPGSELAETA